MKQKYARVHNGVVTHLAQVSSSWIELNPWPGIPGTWIQCGVDVSTGWLYNSVTNEFSPPAK